MIDKMVLEGPQTFDISKLTPEQKDYIARQTLANDRVFKAVLADKEVMADVLRSFLHLDVVDVEYIRTEDYRRAAPDYSSAVKFDVLCKIADGTNVNVEVQNAKDTDLVRRARFYSAVLDAFFADTKKGTDYRISDSCVLFFCSDHSFPFSGSVALGGTRFTVLDGEGVPAHQQGDGRHIVFVNFDKMISGNTVPLGRDAKEFCKLFVTGQQHGASNVFLRALRRLNMFKESGVGMSEILKEQYEREHQEELLRQAQIAGVHSSQLQSAVDCLAALTHAGHNKQSAIDTTKALLKSTPSEIIEQAAKVVFG